MTTIKTLRDLTLDTGACGGVVMVWYGCEHLWPGLGWVVAGLALSGYCLIISRT